MFKFCMDKGYWWKFYKCVYLSVILIEVIRKIFDSYGCKCFKKSIKNKRLLIFQLEQRQCSIRKLIANFAKSAEKCILLYKKSPEPEKNLLIIQNETKEEKKNNANFILPGYSLLFIIHISLVYRIFVNTFNTYKRFNRFGNIYGFCFSYFFNKLSNSSSI